MKLIRIDGFEAVEDVTRLFDNALSAMKSYGDDTTVLEAPDFVRIGWRWNGSTWHEPEREGFAYDIESDRLIPHDAYRVLLHQRTVDDVLEAERKIRAGDTSIDWQAWLDALDAYNKAVSDTKLQDTYPDKVVYPEFPTKPTS